jgi:hypothetical protein
MSTSPDSTTIDTQATSTIQAGPTLKKLSPYKQKRKEERDIKFNRTNPSYSDNDESIDDQENDDTDMSDKITCGEFQYAGDQLSIGTRWTTWNELFDLYVTANGLADAGKIKASYLLLMGKEAYEIYKTKKKADNTDTLIEIKVFMNSYHLFVN